MKIGKSKYEGYLWYSNKDKPKIISGSEFELEIDEQTCPYIVEGQLFDGTKSISIRYVDGKYVYNEYFVASEEIESSESFYSNRMEGRRLGFVRRWTTFMDPNCEGMETQIPSEMVFVGFMK